MASSKLDIINDAAIELGEAKLTGLTQQCLLAETALAIYDRVYGDVISEAPWRFATQKADLSLDTAEPLNEWSCQYTKPEQCLVIWRTYPSVRYELYGDKVYANATELAVDYTKRVSESYLPDYASRLISLEMAVRMCMTITGDLDLKTRLQSDTRLQRAKAMAIDAMQRPNRVVGSSPFVDCRY